MLSVTRTYPSMFLQTHPLILKVSSLAASLLLGFGIGEIFSLDGWLKILIGAVLAVALAYINRKPAMEQAKVLERSQRITEQGAERAAALEVHKEEMRFANERIRYNSALENISRRRAHIAFGEVDRLRAYTMKLQLLLTENKIEIPAFEFKYYNDLCGDLEEEMRRLTESPPIPPQSIS
jgi:hypothetical protein